MKVMREAMAAEIEPIRRELDARRLEIPELVRQPEVDTLKRNELFAQIADLQTQLELKLFQNAIAIRNILTPEQQRLFFQPMDEEFQRRGGPLGPGHHPEGPPGPRFDRKPDLKRR
jgi:Spy/CpxP family protein refolding chaperone